MKILTRVKLINWHIFSNNTIDIGGNTLITGDNGSGKSTVLDAMQYVLSAGKSKFNSAANENSKRTLESYIRGKTGVEGKEYLRNDNLSSYIVLEFYDEQTQRYQIIGSVFDLYIGNPKPNRSFYQILDTKISDTLFFNKNRVLNRSEFKRNLRDLKKHCIIKEGSNDAKSLFRSALGVESKYYELIPKALAFKPIDKVHSFIYDFLLKEDYVNINDLIDNIRNYKDLGLKLVHVQKECQSLAEVEEAYEQYKLEQKEKRIYEVVSEKFSILELKHKREVSENEIKQNLSIVNSLDKDIPVLEELAENTYKLLLELESSESFQVLQKTEEQLSKYKHNINNLNINITAISNELKNINKHVLSLGIDMVLNTNLDKPDIQLILHKELKNLETKLNSYKTELDEQYFTLKSEMKYKTSEYNKNIDIIDNLQANIITYPLHTTALIKVLTKELQNFYHEDVIVKPFCEYLEIKDESWRNAIEGYLNTQRYYIILNPKYFNKAMHIYEQYKDKLGLHSTRIVDVAKLKDFNTSKEGRLASKVTSTYIHARQYANMLMNQVVCVDELDDIRKYNKAITKTCMIYSNYSVGGINQRYYENPCIGAQAKKLLLIKYCEIEKQQLQELKDLKIKFMQINDKRDIIKKIKIESINHQILNVDKFNHLQKEIRNLEKEIKILKQDQTLLTLNKQIDDKRDLYSAQKQTLDIKKEQRSNSLKIIKSTKQELEAIKKNIENIKEVDLQIELDNTDILTIVSEKVLELRKTYFKDFSKINEVVHKKTIEIDKKVYVYEQDVKNKMLYYNQTFNAGLGNSIESINEYKGIYYRLRDVDIVKRRGQVKEAELKCEQSFEESFISRLSDKINRAKRELNVLNKSLKGKEFNGITYEFIVGASKIKEFRQYYEILASKEKYFKESLFDEVLSEQNKELMNELFERLKNGTNEKDSERILREYTDYRVYMDYDIKMINRNGDITYLSKVNKEKSGGETQIPYYVIIASSFQQAIKYRKGEDSSCIVLFDEAFNNMDESKIKTMMQYYNDLNIQVIIAVPSNRINNITSNVKKIITVVKSNNNHGMIREFTDNG